MALNVIQRTFKISQTLLETIWKNIQLENTARQAFTKIFLRWRHCMRKNMKQVGVSKYSLQR